jgi:hypothetical protein
MRSLLKAFSVFIFTSTAVSAQNYVQPSPDALGLAKYANTPISYYTGTPTINISLTQLVSKELTVPISLSYNASGHKVQEEAGSVGLGWSLVNAGGVITRIVRGLPDELADGYCGSNNRGEQANAQTPSAQFEQNVALGVWDGEPDIFFFNFLGRSGKFYLDASGTAYTIPYQDIIIKPAICVSGRQEWEIIDENGTRYFFGSTASHKETSTYKKVSPSNSPSTSYVSTWHLSKVLNANRTDSLTFTYSSYSAIYYNYYYTKVELSNPCNTSVSQFKNESTQITVSARYPVQINSLAGRIELGWASGRKDISGGVYLSTVSLFNADNQLITKSRLEYSYFNATGCTGSNNLCSRLRLDKVYDLAPDPIASFTYNTTINLPAKNSPNFDHWGFYNGNTVNSWLPSSYYNDLIFTTNNHSFTGASRQPDADKVMANILTRIDQRGGAYQIFEFEIHNGTTAAYSLGTPVGGVRIKSQTISDGSNPPIRHFFKYAKQASSKTSGIAYYIPVYYAYYLGPSNNGNVFRRYSHALAATNDLNGIHIGYSRVVDSVANIGKTVYQFTNFDNTTPEVAFDLFNPVWSTSTSYAWERGNPLKSEVYDNQGRLLSRTTSYYNFNLPNKRSSKGISSINEYYECMTYYDYIALGYNLISRPFTLIKQESEVFDQVNQAKKTVVTNEFEFDPITYQLIKSTQYNAAQPSIKYITATRYSTNSSYFNIMSNGQDCNQSLDNCYTSCASNSNEFERSTCQYTCETNYSNCLTAQPTYSTPMEAALLLLKQRHQTSIPIETTSLFQDASGTKVIGATITLFKTIGTTKKKVVPAENWALKQPGLESAYSYSTVNASRVFTFDNSKFKKILTFDTYDVNMSNLLQQTSYTGIINNYGWSANGLLPLTNSTGTTGQTTRQENFTHKPMVGLTTKTSANGYITKYEYDIYNRLGVVKDKNDHIVSRYRYHYKNETPGFILNAPIKEANPGDNLNFSATDVASSTGGLPKFVWDLGDGRVVDSNSSLVTHSYSTTGAYTVKLSGLNPEYGPVTRTCQVNVYPTMSGNICADGPVLLDLCGSSQPYYESCPTFENQSAWSPVKLTLNLSGGCPSVYIYTWKYKRTSDTTWNSLGGGTNVLVFNVPAGEGTFEVVCDVTDGCGKTFSSSYNVVRYKSDPNCTGGFQQ